MGKLLSAAALFGIYAALILDVFSTTNSSPQTTQMFAAERASTLWRWVRVGALISVLFIVMGAWLAHKEGEDYRAPILGGAIALGIMWYLYSIALRDGGGKIPDRAAASPAGMGPGDWLWLYFPDTAWLQARISPVKVLGRLRRLVFSVCRHREHRADQCRHQAVRHLIRMVLFRNRRPSLMGYRLAGLGLSIRLSLLRQAGILLLSGSGKVNLGGTGSVGSRRC